MSGSYAPLSRVTPALIAKIGNMYCACCKKEEKRVPAVYFFKRPYMTGAAEYRVCEEHMPIIREKAIKYDQAQRSDSHSEADYELSRRYSI